MSRIHPGAHVDSEARLGEGVAVGPGAVIEAGVEVADGAHIAPHAVLYRGTRVGRDVHVGAGSVLGAMPQDFKFEGGESHVEVGDGSTLHQYVTVHRCVEPGAVTRVGAGCVLMVGSHVAHECVLGDRVILANGVMLGGHSVIGSGAFLSGNVVVHQFCQVGELVMVGGGSAVRQDMIPFSLADGHPARPVGLNRVGLRRAGVGNDRIRRLKRAYRTLFHSGLRLEEALARLAGAGGDEIGRLVEFIRGSERGIARPRS